MRALLQRVASASVRVDGQCVGQIGVGWLVLLGIGRGDDASVARWMAEKCVHLRGFCDEAGKMNRSLLEVGGAMLVVSQFTLYGDCSRGRRPGFDAAAAPEIAVQLYETYCQAVRELGVTVEQGIFQADMQVSLINDGPVTLWVERDKRPPQGDEPIVGD